MKGRALRAEMKRAFTIIELLVAMGLLAAMIAGSGVIFRTAVKAQRTANATAEISRKLAAIRSQLNADFKGLRKDGEIFIVWIPGTDISGNGLVDRFERLDRIMFFANGDFQTYRQWPVEPASAPGTVNWQILHGNVARICYIFAKDSDGNRAQSQEPAKRILARTQHIYTSAPVWYTDTANPIPVPPPPYSTFPDPANFSKLANDHYEYDKLTIDQWLNIPWSGVPSLKFDLLTKITEIPFDGQPVVAEPFKGVTVDPSESDTVHMLFCEGVGEFAIQGWSDALQRWVPELDPDGDGDLSDSDFILSPAGDVMAENYSGILYPGKIHQLGPDPKLAQYPAAMVTEANFNDIPGLGRALKFTFKLYDSHGIFKDGKTFTHIVYLGG